MISSPFAVIFTSQRTDEDAAGYAEAADRMESLAREQPGFLGIDSVRGADGFGITVSYWESLAAIAAWRENIEHLAAQQNGRDKWYASYRLSVVKVDRQFTFERDQDL